LTNSIAAPGAPTPLGEDGWLLAGGPLCTTTP
jgi:hypothetical protein